MYSSVNTNERPQAQAVSFFFGTEPPSNPTNESIAPKMKRLQSILTTCGLVKRPASLATDIELEQPDQYYPYINDLPPPVFKAIFEYSVEGIDGSVPLILSLVCKTWRAVMCSQQTMEPILIGIANSHFQEATAKHLLPIFGVDLSKAPQTTQEALAHLDMTAKIVKLVAKSNPLLLHRTSELTKRLPGWMFGLSHTRFSIVTSRNLIFLNRFFDFVYTWNVGKYFKEFIHQDGPNDLFEMRNDFLNNHAMNVFEDKAKIDSWISRHGYSVRSLCPSPPFIANRAATCIPKEITLCPNLEVLDLSHDMIFSLPWYLERCISLKVLLLPAEFPTTDIPSSLLSRTDLQITFMEKTKPQKGPTCHVS